MSRTQHVAGGFCGLISLIYLTQNWGPVFESMEIKSTEAQHRLAVVIPFRDAFPELLQLVPSLDAFLNEQRVDHQFFVVHQTDKYRFNKGALVNIGFVISRKDCDYLAIHDVDLVPLNSDLKYTYPAKGPYHVASPQYHPFYHGSTYTGGIILLTNTQFQKTKGMTNVIWGWGGEDNEFYMRMLAQNLTIYRPAGLKTGAKDTLKNLHDETRRPRDKERFNIEHPNVFKLEPNTGYHNVEYKLESTADMTISGVKVTLHNVKLVCDVSTNDWCI